MKISLIITTYNWPEALDAVLKSVLTQSEMPYEVIIADDGSNQDTVDMVQEWQDKFPIPLIHSWQEDKGFRAAQSRNLALYKSKGDYIVLIDGDMILSKNFIQDHKLNAKKGWFVQGGRVITNEKRAKHIIKTQKKPMCFSSGIRNRKNTISCNFLSKIFSSERNTDKSTRSCNIGIWRSDVIEVNGFNNDFVGWGREDSEFVIRMLNAGKRRLYLKFAAVAFHLYHPENSRASLPENDNLLSDAIKLNLKRCKNGIDKFIEKTEK